MDLRLSGKRAVITGASKGIGRAVAETLAQEGCNLLLASRSDDTLEAARKVLAERYPVEVSVWPVDLADCNLAALPWAAQSPPDILINNAGAIPAGPLEEVDDARWRAAWDLKVFGYINLTRAVYSQMKSVGRGVILNIIGLAGELPRAGYIAGSSGNAALIAFTRALGGTAPDDNIRVLGINPGLVTTERMVTMLKVRAEETFGDPTRWPEFLDHLPFGRAAAPEEVAELTAFLASDRAGYISGTTVTIDGGASTRNFAY
ncbi:MAG: SDR family oxidoreductase [Gammaproteobacteria bacterium]|nr:SDR family oxidoreductase [Gammaproteobacteria bacterium]